IQVIRRMPRKSWNTFRFPPLVSGLQTAATRAPPITANPAVNAFWTLPPPWGPKNPATTMPTMQAATITYSNEITPSLSARKRFTASRALKAYLGMTGIFLVPGRRVRRSRFGRKRLGRQPGAPPEYRAVSNRRCELGRDSRYAARQRRADSATSARAEGSSHCADDASRDDDVLERHHAVLVVAQTLQQVAGLNVIL